MKKGQWQYECECGFKLWHTVAKVELSEEIIIELLTTGKTRQKVTGFTSKAGNVFDTCLKYEDEQIKFDFDNPGEQSFIDEIEMEDKEAQNASVKPLEELKDTAQELQKERSEEATEISDATDDEFMYLQQMAEYVEEENLMVDEELLALAHEMH